LADMIIPVQSDEGKYGGSLPYIKILDSPGVVLIVPHSDSSVKEWKVVLKAVLGTWPVVLMAVLMSSVAGVFIWALVSLSPYNKQVQVFKINCNVKMAAG